MSVRYDPWKPKGIGPVAGHHLLTGAVIIWFALLILVPVAGIAREAFRSGVSVFAASLATPEARHAFITTIWITIAAVATNTFFGVILSIVLVKHRFPGKMFLDGLVDLPFAVSPVVAGFMFVVLFGSHGWIGGWVELHGFKIIYAYPGMLIATIFVTFPFVVREVTPVLKEFGSNQDEAAHVLGASPWQTFWKVTLPSIRWGLAYGVTLTMARAIGEFGAVLVVSGSIINKTQTATLHIHQEFTDYNFAAAFAAALVLGVISFVILTSMQWFCRRKGVV